MAISASELKRRLEANPRGAEAQALADELRAQVGAEPLAKGSVTVVEDLVACWVVELPGAGAAPDLVHDVGSDVDRPTQRLGETDLFWAAGVFPDGTCARFHYELAGESRGGGQVEIYQRHPDSLPRDDAPRGRVLTQPRWHSSVFAGTVRNWSIYVPAQYRAEEPACVMVFQDGVRQYQDFMPTVFDNLIASGDMPVTIGVFIDPGVFADTTVSNRSFEYDTLSDQYARFVLDEILPAVGREYALRDDPESRAICGISSGGICAWTVAWQRPDAFRKVLSHVGSFTNIAAGTPLREGGHNYAALIRKVPPKPIRAFLQDGENDLNNVHGSWWLANLQMVDSLRFAGYDYRFASGIGFHSLAHGKAIMPDSLRWLWRGHASLGGGRA